MTKKYSTYNFNADYLFSFDYSYLPPNDLHDIAASNKIYVCVKIKVINFKSISFFNIILAILSALRITKVIGIVDGRIALANSKIVSTCATANAN